MESIPQSDGGTGLMYARVDFTERSTTSASSARSASQAMSSSSSPATSSSSAGNLQLMELEIFEPALFTHGSDRGAERYAQAIAEKLNT